MDMENPVKKHYQTLLAEHYPVIAGELPEKVADTKAYFAGNDLLPQKTGLALDLDCGLGIQSLALAELEFQVLAVDFSENLLLQVEQLKGTLPIYTKQADFTELAEAPLLYPEVVCCMGDTLPQLPSLETIQNCLHRWSQWLVDRGKVVVSYREYAEELEEEDRFLPVYQSENLLFTCFLEYFPDRVRVTDLVHQRDAISGEWQQKASSYWKWRIPEHLLAEMIMAAGLHLNSVHVKDGFTYIIAQKEVA